jgi:hypothetical protein
MKILKLTKPEMLLMETCMSPGLRRSAPYLKNYLLKYINNKKFWEELIAYFSSHYILNILYNTNRIENTASSSSSVVACVFVYRAVA